LSEAGLIVLFAPATLVLLTCANSAEVLAIVEKMTVAKNAARGAGFRNFTVTNYQ
jgi:hypothetical protein